MIYRLPFLSLKFAGMDFVVSIISSNLITKLSIILAKYLPFLQLHVAGLPIYSFSFNPVNMLKTLRGQPSVLFRRHTLLDRSLKVLQLPTHLSKLTANG